MLLASSIVVLALLLLHIWSSRSNEVGRAVISPTRISRPESVVSFRGWREDTAQREAGETKSLGQSDYDY